MKRWVWLMAFAAMLTGCGAEETFETVMDEPVVAAMASPGKITVQLPPGTAAPVLETENQQIYVGDTYEIAVETLEGGDLDATLRALTGYPRDELTLLETQWENVTRYEFVWAAAGEEGDRLGRAVVLDDGAYHYCLSLVRDAAVSSDTAAWNDLFGSFSLRTG